MAETPQIDIETTNDGFSLTEKTYSGIPTDERYPLYQVDHALSQFTPERIQRISDVVSKGVFNKDRTPEEIRQQLIGILNDLESLSPERLSCAIMSLGAATNPDGNNEGNVRNFLNRPVQVIVDELLGNGEQEGKKKDENTLHKDGDGLSGRLHPGKAYNSNNPLASKVQEINKKIGERTESMIMQGM